MMIAIIIVVHAAANNPVVSQILIFLLIYRAGGSIFPSQEDNFIPQGFTTLRDVTV